MSCLRHSAFGDRRSRSFVVGSPESPESTDQSTIYPLHLLSPPPRIPASFSAKDVTLSLPTFNKTHPQKSRGRFGSRRKTPPGGITGLVILTATRTLQAQVHLESAYKLSYRREVMGGC